MSEPTLNELLTARGLTHRRANDVSINHEIVESATGDVVFAGTVSDVWKWIKTLASHVLHECGDESCVVCRGGLALCTVCGGGEASLPTDCPGRRMTDVQEDDVWHCGKDFRNGRWTVRLPRT